jgi:hypothetical protein
LDDLIHEVARVKSDIEPAGRLMRWMGRLSPAFSWLPIARSEIPAWAKQAERVRKDLDAASELLVSSSSLLDNLSDAERVVLTARASPYIPALRVRVQALGTSFSASLDAVVDARRAGRAFSVGLLVPRVRNLTRPLAELEDRMFTASELGQRTSGLLVELLDLADGAQPLMRQFTVDGSESQVWSTDTLKATLVSVNTRAVSARSQAAEVAKLVSATGEAHELLPRLATLDQILAVLHTVSRAGMVSLAAVEPTAKLMESGNGGLLNGGEGLIDILDAFVEHGEEISQSIVELQEARQILDNLVVSGEQPLLAGRLSDIAALVNELESGLRLVHRMAPRGRELLAADGVRRYLLLGQSADELRGIGGFVSSVWLLTFENGGLASVKYHDSVRVDDWDRLVLYPKAPPALDEHMNAWVWLLRDVSWDPDFPTTAGSAEDLYRLGQRQAVDGVFAINQWTLLPLLDALGEVPSPGGGEPVTARNLLSVLEQGTDQYGRAYMNLVLQGIIDKLNQPMSLPTLVRLASVLSGTLEKRDTLVFFNDPGLRSVVGEFGWDGSVRDGSTDYLYVVDSNVGWSKVDRNIERGVSYFVDLRRESRPRVNLTLRYHNHSGPGSPVCEPQWRHRGTNYTQMKNACYWNFLRVYMPQGSRILSSTPMPLPEYSVSVEIGRGVPGEDSARISSSHNKLVFSGLFSLEAGAQGEINLVYDLPPSVIRREGDTLTYQLLLQKQPGVRERQVTVDIVPPAGYRLLSSSIPAVRTTDTRASFAIMLREDTLLDVEFRKDASESP